MLPILSGVQPGQLNASTPCADWNVLNLINHQLKVAQFFYEVVAETGAADPSAMGVVNDPLPPGGGRAAFEAGTAKVLEAIKAPGVLEEIVDTPFGQMPAGHFLMLPFGDILLHKWDLAKATNQNTSIDSSLAEASFGASSQGIEQGRLAGFFGPEVMVPISASMQDKLLGLSGRTP